MATTTQKADGVTPDLIEKLLGNAKQALFAAVEIHNKPVFPYRYEVCTLLVINAWELLLKAFIAAKLPTVSLLDKDGRSKPFGECVECVSATVGKTFYATAHNLKLLYKYRNEVAHFCTDELDVIVLGLLKASVSFFAIFIEDVFGIGLQDEAHLILLPIGFTKPVSPIDFISNRSGSTHASPEAKAFLNAMKSSAEELQKAGIEDSVVVNFSIGLINELRIKNADLTAAINNSITQGNIIAVRNVISSANLTTNPDAKEVRLTEESIFREVFTESYEDVVRTARKLFAGFSQNAAFHQVMRKLKGDANLMRSRFLDAKYPKGGRKDYYSKQIYEALAQHYRTLRDVKTQT